MHSMRTSAIDDAGRRSFYLSRCFVRLRCAKRLNESRSRLGRRLEDPRNIKRIRCGLRQIVLLVCRLLKGLERVKPTE